MKKKETKHKIYYTTKLRQFLQNPNERKQKKKKKEKLSKHKST